MFPLAEAWRNRNRPEAAHTRRLEYLYNFGNGAFLKTWQFGVLPDGDGFTVRCYAKQQIGDMFSLTMARGLSRAAAEDWAEAEIERLRAIAQDEKGKGFVASRIALTDAAPVEPAYRWFRIGSENYRMATPPYPEGHPYRTTFAFQ